jgi:hypothetical protein
MFPRAWTSDTKIAADQLPVERPYPLPVTVVERIAAIA